MSERLACCVLGCKRTCNNIKGYSDFLCSKHWPMVTPYMRRRHSRLARLYRKRFGDNAYWTYPAGSEKRLEAVKLERLCRKAWSICKAQAIERAMGI